MGHGGGGAVDDVDAAVHGEREVVHGQPRIEPEIDDEARRTAGIARLFYPGRHASRSASAPGEEIHRLVGQLVDPDDVVFFDWSPHGTTEPDGTTGAAGAIVLMTARTLTQVTYRLPRTGRVDAHVNGHSGGHDSGARPAEPVAASIAVHRLERVRSLHWSTGESMGVGTNGRGKRHQHRHRLRQGIVIVGDDWEVTVSGAGSADHVPYLTQLLHLG